jgi:hypothetical protein
MTKPLSERSFVGTRFGYAEPISTSILVNHVCYTLHCYLSLLYDVLNEFLDIVSILVCVKHIILLLSSGVAVLPSPDHLTSSGCPPMAVLHPQKSCRSWIYHGSQIWISQSQISYHRFILCFDMPHHYFYQPLNF